MRPGKGREACMLAKIRRRSSITVWSVERLLVNNSYSWWIQRRAIQRYFRKFTALSVSSFPQASAGAVKSSTAPFGESGRFFRHLWFTSMENCQFKMRDERFFSVNDEKDAHSGNGFRRFRTLVITRLHIVGESGGSAAFSPLSAISDPPQASLTRGIQNWMRHHYLRDTGWTQ
jgi:hypothetical protein